MVRQILRRLRPRRDKVLESFKKDFTSIKKKGFVPSMRSHDTGIGKTFEELVGVTENNNLLVDYQDVLELKSSRNLTGSMVTLFTKSPSHPEGANTYLREKYGQIDRKEGGLKTLHSTVSATRFNTYFSKFGFKLKVNKRARKIFLLIKDLTTDEIIDKSVYYTFRDLKKIITKKCKYIAFITADSKKIRGKESFNFKKALLLKGLTFPKFIKFINKGYIVYDIRIGVYRSGKSKGRTHDHGSGFRILKNKIDKVFKVKEI